MPTDPERDALIEETLARLREKLQKNLPAEDATLEQIEEAVEEIGSDVFRDLQERLVNQRRKKPRQNHLACPCGRWARYRKMQTRTLITRHGLLVWKRPYYYCDACQRGSFPLDASLGLDKADTTPQVRAWIAHLAPQLGFVQAADALLCLRGIDVSAATVERVAVQTGTSLRAAQQKEATLHYCDTLPDKKRPRPRRLYIGADGVMVPLREPWKKDGSGGDLVCRFGECKTAVVYETYQNGDGRDQRLKTRAYSATLGAVEVFEQLLATLAHERGHHGAQEVVVLGDGAAWIWNMFARQFPGAVQILDFYHACDHLSSVAEAIYGKGSDLSRAWQKARQAELKADGVQAVLRAIFAWKPASKDAHKLRRDTFAYFRRNAARMRYGSFLQKGYHISSGIVEAACKHVVAQRMDQAGMHWTATVAEAMVALRANHLSTYLSDLRPHLAFAA